MPIPDDDLVTQLTNSVFEIVRWTFVSSERGLPSLSFFALGTSTTYLDLLMILWKASKSICSTVIHNASGIVMALRSGFFKGTDS